MAMTYEMIANALFENYESIYDINIKTHAYKTYYQSSMYQTLKLAKEGKDFFLDLPAGIERIIAEQDQDYVNKKLEFDRLYKGVKRHKYYTLVYRIKNEKGLIYHQLRATLQIADGEQHILMGVRNINDIMRQQILHEQEIETMWQKSQTHLSAILATAAAYLEADLSEDIVLSTSKHLRNMSDVFALPVTPNKTSYSELQAWIVKHKILSNHDKYIVISSASYLITLFHRGEKRASVLFNIKDINGDDLPCRAVFFLYQDTTTSHVMVFCVIYDLTEQQKKDREIASLEKQLFMSRLKNANSQIQPHFLYNTLGSIQEIILMNPKYASDLLGDFTIHLKSCLKAISSDALVPFAEELETIKAYVNIEKMRFGDRLAIQYEVEKDDFLIPPLSIQPIVENAIRHGLYQKGKSVGLLVIRAKDCGSYIIIQVQDNGVGFDVSKYYDDIKNGKIDATGLKNIKFRLEKLINASVNIGSVPDLGTTITICIPKGDAA